MPRTPPAKTTPRARIARLRLRQGVVERSVPSNRDIILDDRRHALDLDRRRFSEGGPSDDQTLVGNGGADVDVHAYRRRTNGCRDRQRRAGIVAQHVDD